jgi:hypothetical protein
VNNYVCIYLAYTVGTRCWDFTGLAAYSSMLADCAGMRCTPLALTLSTEAELGHGSKADPRFNYVNGLPCHRTRHQSQPEHCTCTSILLSYIPWTASWLHTW